MHHVLSLSVAALFATTAVGLAQAQQPGGNGDSALTSKVRAELIRHMGAEADQIKAEVRNGIAYLSATDRANSQMQRAKIIAASVPEVMQVVQVDPTAWGQVKAGGGRLTLVVSDTALERSARDALVQRFGVDKAGKLQVQVRGGIVSVRALPGNRVSRSETDGALRGLPGARGIDVRGVPDTLRP